MSCSCVGLCPLNTAKVSFSRRTRFWSRRLLEKGTNLSKNTFLITRTHIRHCIQLSSIQYKNKQSCRFVLCSFTHTGTVLFSDVRTTESSTNSKKQTAEVWPTVIPNCGTTVELDLPTTPTSLEADCRLKHAPTIQICVSAPTDQATRSAVFT